MTNDDDLDSAVAEFMHCHEQNSGAGITLEQFFAKDYFNDFEEIYK